MYPKKTEEETRLGRSSLANASIQKPNYNSAMHVKINEGENNNRIGRKGDFE
jgi:hypothetical protein